MISITRSVLEGCIVRRGRAGLRSGYRLRPIFFQPVFFTSERSSGAQVRRCRGSRIAADSWPTATATRALITSIGKESNSLEVQAVLVHDEQNAYTVYDDPQRSYWQTKVLPAVKQIALATLIKACAGKLSRRALIDIRAGRSMPHRRNQELLGRLCID
jgi:hypothetical protein